jgi:glyoxylase-like metal-dependent hydrolase (beta-lactamase superfamily II)
VTAIPRRQPSGLYHLAIGDALVTAVNDGTFQAAFDLIAGIDHAECERIEAAAFRPVPPKMTMNAFLVQIGGRRTLIDTGCGASMGPTLGMVRDNLRSMGVAPEEIDTILVTHLHPDHVNGLVDEQGRAVYSKAELVVNEAELQFFRDPDSPRRAPSRRWSSSRARSAPSLLTRAASARFAMVPWRPA